MGQGAAHHRNVGGGKLISQDNLIDIQEADLPLNQRLVVQVIDGKRVAVPVGVNISDRWVNTNGATASADDIRQGKTGYANGVKITGSRTIPVPPQPMPDIGQSAWNTFCLAEGGIDEVNGVYHFDTTLRLIPEVSNELVTVRYAGWVQGNYIVHNVVPPDAAVSTQFVFLSPLGEPFNHLYRCSVDTMHQPGTRWQVVNGKAPAPVTKALEE